MVAENHPLADHVLHIQVIGHGAHHVRPETFALQQRQFDQLAAGDVVDAQDHRFIVVLFLRQTQDHPQVLIAAVDVRQFDFQFQLLLLLQDGVEDLIADRTLTLRIAVDQQLPGVLTRIDVEQLQRDHKQSQACDYLETLQGIHPDLDVNKEGQTLPFLRRRCLLSRLLLQTLQNRIGAAFVRGSNHFGPISPYCYLAAEEGFASMIGSNATTTIAPWGGSDARLGNSPLGFGAPGAHGAHFMLDMAMSVVARAKIRNALKAGQSIPETWATDSAGRPTSDPKEALNGFLLPIGGHKGYGLALMVDLFAGLLSDAAYLTHVKSWVDAPDEPQNLGHFFLLIDTRRLGSSAWLASRMSDFAAILHGSPSVQADKPVIVPGEIELSNMARQRASGIEIDAATMDLLRKRAGR